MDYRRDSLDHRQSLDRVSPADVSAGGVILWRLVKGRQDLWCLVFEHSAAFFMVLDDNPEGTQAYRLCEQHDTIASVVDRSDVLRDSFLSSGWRPVDVE